MINDSGIVKDHECKPELVHRDSGIDLSTSVKTPDPDIISISDPSPEDASYTAYDLLSACQEALKAHRTLSWHGVPCRDIAIEDIKIGDDDENGLVSEDEEKWFKHFDERSSWPYGRGTTSMWHFWPIHLMMDEDEPYTLFDERESQLQVFIWMSLSHLKLVDGPPGSFFNWSFPRSLARYGPDTDEIELLGRTKLRSLLTDIDGEYGLKKVKFASPIIGDILASAISIAANCHRKSPCQVGSGRKHKEAGQPLSEDYHKMVSGDYLPRIIREAIERSESSPDSWQKNDKGGRIQCAWTVTRTQLPWY